MYLAVLLPAFPLALSILRLLLFNSGLSKVGLPEGLVVSAAALLCPAEDDVVIEDVAGVEAGLDMAPLYKFKNDEATAEDAVVSMAWGQDFSQLYCLSAKVIVLMMWFDDGIV